MNSVDARNDRWTRAGLTARRSEPSLVARVFQGVRIDAHGHAVVKGPRLWGGSSKAEAINLARKAQPLLEKELAARRRGRLITGPKKTVRVVGPGVSK